MASGRPVSPKAGNVKVQPVDPKHESQEQERFEKAMKKRIRDGRLQQWLSNGDQVSAMPVPVGRR